MSAPVFLAPLGIEAAAIRRGAPGARVERVGMGPVRATAARVRIGLAFSEPTELVLLGLGGGLRTGGRAGDVVVATSLQLLDSSDEVALAGADRIVAALRQAGLEAIGAPVVSSPRILHGPAARAAATSRGAAAVDMESYWCSPLAERHGFVVCRVLSDVPGQDLVSLRTPPALWRAFRTLRIVARTIAALPATTVDSRSVEEADL